MSDQNVSHRPERPSVGVHSKCCNVYSKIYANHALSAYSGHCPRCATLIEIPIVNEGGSSSQFFSGS
jgi:hypothetical protein